MVQYIRLGICAFNRKESYKSFDRFNIMCNVHVCIFFVFLMTFFALKVFSQFQFLNDVERGDVPYTSKGEYSIILNNHKIACSKAWTKNKVPFCGIFI